MVSSFAELALLCQFMS